METVHGKAAAAEAGRRDCCRTKAASADRRGAESATAHSNRAAVETATTVETTTTVETATPSGQGRVRRQHGDRCSSEQGDHRFA
jgi:hypothetical protein